MDVGHWISRAAARRPDRVALEASGESVTYRELLLRAVRAAGALHMRGVRRGDPVALALEPGLPFVEALHGCLLLGAPAVPVDPRLGERERRAILRKRPNVTSWRVLLETARREHLALQGRTVGQPVAHTAGRRTA